MISLYNDILWYNTSVRKLIISYPSSRSSIDKLPIGNLNDGRRWYHDRIHSGTFYIIIYDNSLSKFSTRLDKKDDSLQAEISVTEDNDIKRKK